MSDYEIIYSKRKTIGITVERDRTVVIRAPLEASGQAVTSVLQQKQLWIWDKLRDPRKYSSPPNRKEYVSGETFLFLGQHFSLVLAEGRTGVVSFDGHQFEIARSDTRKGTQLFRSWYIKQAKTILPSRIASFAEAMGVTYKCVNVGDLKHRWASYSQRGTLTFNWRIIQAPMIVIDYLIAHELAHVLEPNHTAEFWNIVAVHVPGWEKARSWLRQNGSRLDW